MTARKKEVLTVEDNRSQDYELVFIVSPEVAEDSLENAIGSVSQFGGVRRNWHILWNTF